MSYQQHKFITIVTGSGISILDIKMCFLYLRIDLRPRRQKIQQKYQRMLKCQKQSMLQNQFKHFQLVDYHIPVHIYTISMEWSIFI